MWPGDLESRLRCYFITDEAAPDSFLTQVRAALDGGATMVQYRYKKFGPGDFRQLCQIRDLCRGRAVPLLVNDDIILARALGADGVHLGQTDADVATARGILGRRAIIGVSVSTPAELASTDTEKCDYLGTGPVFGTSSKADAKATIGLTGLSAVVARTDRPVVAIGGIDAARAGDCLAAGAVGVAVISFVSRAPDPVERTRALVRACGWRTPPQAASAARWSEFELIRQCLAAASPPVSRKSVLVVGPGDDAAVLRDIRSPVVSTDAQVEDVHFRFDWQTPWEVGYKAAITALSDLAAAYARPLAMFVNFSFPGNVPDQVCCQIYEGLGEALREYDCELGGGNTAGSGAVALDLFVLGTSRTSFYPSRSQAVAGDYVCCTGPLGLARAGLQALQNQDLSWPDLVLKFKRPRARFDAARILAAAGVRCVIDISDGLAGDARHIAQDSGVTIKFDLSPDLVSPPLSAYCEKTGQTTAAMMLQGGEDYELLFTCSAAQLAKIQKQLPGVQVVGRCLSHTGEDLLNAEGAFSFQHGDGASD